METEQVVRELQTDSRMGLGLAEVKQRLAKFGLNQLQEAPSPGLLSLLVKQITEPLVFILIIAALISGILGEIGDALLILLIVVLNAVLGVLQEKKAERALQALKAMTKVYVQVVREGITTEVAAENLVPGDLVFLNAGDAVPADARLLEAMALGVNESALTGESLPVEKNVAPLTAENVPLAERQNMLFAGTTITSGRAEAIVSATGGQTELGKIAAMLQQAPREETPLQGQLAKLGGILGWIALVIVVLVFFTGIGRGEDFLQMFMTAIALAVAAIPEGLPAVVTIVLALGVTRMSRQQAVIRKLPAVETLGVATYICSDKTGTLTKNEMTVTSLYLGDRFFQVTGSGYLPEGEFLTEAGYKVGPEDEADLRFLLRGGVLSCDACLEENGSGVHIIGDPTEGALLVAGLKAGFKREELAQEHPRLAEIPFEATRKMMTVFCPLGAEIYSITKGAPDFLLSRCRQIWTRNGEENLTEEIRHRLLQVNQKLAAQGQRVLALAVRQWAAVPREDFSAEKVEKELTFVGFFALEDPPREEAAAAVALSRRAGIKTVMITGDHADTAMAIARKLGIWREGDLFLTGPQLAKMSATELKEQVREVTVYARVSPEHKLRIVDALKENREVVAMTGDGVNDAPALKRADIGAAMGITGTEVAKEAADMVLLDDNFATIVRAVEEGRTIYDNIRKVVQYLLSCNLGEVITIFAAILLGMGSPLLPVQILWLNLVTDGAPALALGVEPPEKGIMRRRPRNARAGIFAGGVGREVFLQGITLGLIAFGAYWLALRGGRSLGEAQTIAFLTMAFSQLVHSFNLRSRTESLFGRGPKPGKMLLGAFALCVFLQLIVVLIPFLQRIFKTVWLRPEDWLLVALFSLLPLLLVEIMKFMNRTFGTLGLSRSDLH